MPAPAAADTRYLEIHGSQWRVVVNVPAKLRASLGTKLKRPLGTDSIKEANRLKWDVVAELKAVIDQAQNPELSEGVALARSKVRAMEEARRLSRQRQMAYDLEQRNRIDDSIEEYAEGLAGPPVGSDDRGDPIYDDHRDRIAMDFLSLAKGDRTPIDFHHTKFLEMSNVKPRTAADDVRALKFLKEWCSDKGVPPYLQNFTKREAVRFGDDLKGLIGGDLSPVTLNKYISRLSVYWAWLENRHEVEDNIWRGRRLKEPQQSTDDSERPFTDEEMLKLLSGPADQAMQDVMRIGALTGSRLDPIVCLKVKDCENGAFKFKPQKKEPGSRLCPIHSSLTEIVARRTAGKLPDDDLFPEWPGVKKSKSLRERSFKTSNDFMDYRRSVGVEDTRPGKRRGLVNYHSFRRWFITKAEQAGQLESIIAVVVGHKRQGMTLGVYSGGPLLEQARTCVEAVRLPE